MKEASSFVQSPFDYIRELTSEDVKTIGTSFQLRRMDQVEAMAMTGLAPSDALLATLFKSEFARSLHHPRYGLVGFLGVIQHSPTLASPWMVGNDGLTKSKIEVTREGRNHFLELYGWYKFLFNYVAAENIRSLRWLQWLGFTVDWTPLFFKHPEIPFHLFYKEN